MLALACTVPGTRESYDKAVYCLDSSVLFVVCFYVDASSTLGTTCVCVVGRTMCVVGSVAMASSMGHMHTFRLWHSPIRYN